MPENHIFVGCAAIRHPGQWSEAERESGSSIRLILYIFLYSAPHAAFGEMRTYNVTTYANPESDSIFKAEYFLTHDNNIYDVLDLAQHCMRLWRKFISNMNNKANLTGCSTDWSPVAVFIKGAIVIAA